MLTDRININQIDSEQQFHLQEKWYDFVNDHNDLLSINELICFNVKDLNQHNNIIYNDVFFERWSNIIHSIENDIFYITRTSLTTENIRLLYNHSSILYHSPLNSTVMIIQCFYYITKGFYTEEDAKNVELITHFLLTNKHLFTSYEQQYIELMDGIKHFYLHEEEQNILKLKNILYSKNDIYIKSYAVYVLLNVYRSTGKYFEGLMLRSLGKEILSEVGNFRRLIYFDGICAISSMILGNSLDCIEIQKNTIDLCIIHNYQDILQHQLKHIIWSYIRLDQWEEIKNLLQTIDSTLPLFQDKLFMQHLTLFYLEIGVKDQSKYCLEQVKQIPTTNPVYDLITDYLDAKWNEEDLEKPLIQIIQYGSTHYVNEVVDYYTPLLIELLQEKRKYKDVVNYQSLILHNKIENLI